jgi:hypothetical protein
MAEWRVMVQDVANGSLEMRDATSVYDAKASTLPRAAREKAPEGKAVFRFPNDQANVPDIREGAEVWAGWVSGDVFLSALRPFGGFITQIAGSATGATHIMECTVSSYQRLLDAATIIGWPTGEANGVPTEGYPGGWSVGDWLRGATSAGRPFDGVVRAYLPNVLYDGVADLFDTLIWTDDNKPGTPDPDFPFVGQWGFTQLSKVLGDFVGGVRAVWPAIEPVYWLEAAAAGSSIVPRFQFVDKRATGGGGIKGHWTVTPGAGDLWIG